MSVVVYPDSIATIVGVLRGVIPSASFGTEVPETWTGAGGLVVVNRAGGPQFLTHEIVRLLVNVWHQTQEDAHDLAQQVAAQVRAMRGTYNGVSITAPDVMSLSWVPDEYGKPRFLLIAEITVRGDVQ